MAKARTIEQILAENGLAFAPNMEQHYMDELEGIWNEACEESGGEITHCQIQPFHAAPEVIVELGEVPDAGVELLHGLM